MLVHIRNLENVVARSSQNIVLVQFGVPVSASMKMIKMGGLNGFYHAFGC